LIGRANTLSSLLRFEESLPDYDKYLELEKEDGKAYMWRGIAKFRTNKFIEAISDLDIAISMIPNNYEPYYWKGLAYLELKEFKKALDNLNIAASYNSSMAELYYWRGWANQNLNNIDAAISDYSLSIQNNINTGFSLANRSKMFVLKGEYEKAFNDLLQAQSLRHPLDKDNFFRVKETRWKISSFSYLLSQKI
jgi:tetratricopeptide (TPR) repeat protein